MVSSNEPIRVLHVDHESSVRETVSSVLSTEFERVSVVTESAPADGRERLAESSIEIDCVVCEHEFPESADGGLEFLRTVRNSWGDLPFVLFTSAGSEAVASEAISLDVTEYLEKDTRRDHLRELGERVTSAVEDHRETIATRQAETRLDELTQTSRDCLWIFDGGWEELLFISGYESVWDRPAEAIKDDPRDFLRAVHPDDRPLVREKMTELSEGLAIDTEYRIVKGDGETGWVWVKGEPVFDEAGNVVRVVGFTRDITARKQRDRELREERRFIDQAIDALEDVFYVVGTEGRLERWNERLEEVTALSSEALDGKRATDLFPAADRDRVAAAIEETLTTGTTTIEADLIANLGSEREREEWIPHEFRGRRLRDADGDIVGLVGIGRDISERKERERELELRTRAINEAPVGIVITDPSREDNPITYANNGFQEMTQYSEQEALDRNCRFLQGPLTEAESRAALRKAIDERTPIQRDILNYRKDGTPFWNDLRVTPVFDESDELSHYIGFQTDVTTRVEQERRTDLLQKILRHNLRNELNVILGNLSMIKEETGESDATREIKRSATHLIELSESAHRIEAHLEGASFAPGEIDIESLLNEEIATVSDRHEDVAFEPSIDSCVSVLAPDSISIAIRELLENAAKHAPEGSSPVRVTTETETQVRPPEGTDRDVVTIHVEDRNPPISDMELTRLLGKQESAVQHGTGLGLWLVHWMVTMSGGVIAHEHVDPTGNRVSITLLEATSGVEGEP
jgi:PAS domain S-box-containing protein